MSYQERSTVSTAGSSFSPEPITNQLNTDYEQKIKSLNQQVAMLANENQTLRKQIEHLGKGVPQVSANNDDLVRSL